MKARKAGAKGGLPMPHVPAELKARLKREVSIQRLAEARGIRLVRKGKSLMGLCPFHEDHNPSLSIDPAENRWHCFGCGQKGDVIEWVMRAEGVSFNHAVELLSRDSVPLAGSAGAPPKQSTVPKLPPLFQPNADDQTVLQVVVNFYHEALKNSPQAQQYLVKRGLESGEMIEHFRLGYANRTLTYHVPEKNRVLGREQRGRLEELGILREKSGHEHFNGSLVIPILTLEGELVQMYGRKVTSNLREGTPDHLYLPGPHRGVWNEAALIASREIILCESLIDALTFWCAGFRHVTTSYGVNGFTEEHREAFCKHATKRIYIAYDRDESGDHAAAKHAEELMGMGIECLRVQFPKGVDANDYARTTKPADKALGMLLSRAVWLGKGQRPTVAVSEAPTPSSQDEAPTAEQQTAKNPKPAVKEKSTHDAESATDPGEVAAADPEQPVFSLTAPLPLLSPLPFGAVPAVEMPVEIRGEEIWITQGPRRYRVLFLDKKPASGKLSVNVLVEGQTPRGVTSFHVDALDLYTARLRTVYAKQAAAELDAKEETIERELRLLLRRLEVLQQERLKETLEPKDANAEMSEQEKSAALELLRSPNLLERIVGDFERCGVTGEDTNKQLGYLAAVSRLLESPLAVMVQSSSAAGKSSLMDAVLAFVPAEHRIQYSAMTGQSLFYLGEKDLKHKILAIAEEEGARRASYALKLLQSEGELSIASTSKDPNTGRLGTHEYRVEGPVMIFLTTTAIDIDEELLNRCVVLTVNEDQAQTRAIHQKQREAQTLEGLWARQQRTDILAVHRNAQRLLRPLAITNPHALELSFPSNRTRTRRDHMKFLTLIQAITLLHQYQREIRRDTRGGKTLEYIEATAADVELARKLVSEVLMHSLYELQPQTRKLLFLVEQMVAGVCAEQKIERSDYRFSRRTVRQHTSWGDSQLKKHLHRLEEMEYLIVHRGGRGQTFVYELDFAVDENGKPVLPGLGYHYDENKSRPEGDLARPSHAQVTGLSRGGHTAESRMDTGASGDFKQNRENRIDTDRGENRVVIVPVSERPNGHAKMPAVGVR
jgi:DNA primase catalytic core